MAFLRALITMTMLELRRQFFRSGVFFFTVACGLFAWYFGKRNYFGPDAIVWFSGGEQAARLVPVVLMIVATIWGVRMEGAYARSRSVGLLGGRVWASAVAVPARLVAITLLLIPGVLLLTLWAPMGAWSGDLPVLWSANVWYLLVVAIPALLVGGGAGIFARYLVGSDAGGLLCSALLLALPSVFVCLYADAAELFLLSADGLGVLIPPSLLLRDGAILAAFGFLPVALRILEPTLGLDAVKLRGASLAMVAIFALLAVPVVGGIGGLFQFGKEVVATREAPVLDQIITGRVVAKSIEIPRKSTDKFRVTLDVASERAGDIHIRTGRFLSVVDVEDELPFRREHGGIVVPLSQPGELRIVYTMRPLVSAERRWTSCFQEDFIALPLLGDWWGGILGEGDTNRFDTEVVLPATEGKSWLAGGILYSATSDRRVMLSEKDLPLLTAADFRTDDVRVGNLTIDVLTVGIPAGEAASVLRLYDQQLSRFAGLLDGERHAIAAVLPFETSEYPQALGASRLRRLQNLAPFYRDYAGESRRFFEDLLMPFHAELTSQLFGSIAGRESDAALRDGLARYLNRVALHEGIESNRIRSDRRRTAIVPLNLIELPEDYLRVRPGDRERWLGALVEAGPTAVARAEAFWHMLRGELGDAHFEELIRRVSSPEVVLDSATITRRAEDVSGRPLAGFIAQWIDIGVLPDYQILEAAAYIEENRAAGTFTYRVRGRIRNNGNSAVNVPIVVFTEGDPVQEKLLLAEGEEVSVTIEALSRPVAMEVDPQRSVVHLSRLGSDQRPDTTRTRAVFRGIVRIATE